MKVIEVELTYQELQQLYKDSMVAHEEAKDGIRLLLKWIKSHCEHEEYLDAVMNLQEFYEENDKADRLRESEVVDAKG